MALDTSDGDFCVFFFVFLLQLLMTPRAIIVISELQVEFLLVLRKLLFACYCRFVVTFTAFFDFVTFLPDVFAALIQVMAIVAGDAVLFSVLLV